MTQNQPLILITNDDGYEAKGINSLVDSLVGLGEIVVVAPDGPRSGMSGSITSLQPIRYRLHERDEERNVTVYTCTGTPVDCVKLGISEIVGRKPDLLVSGINHGSNANICVHYSGTMGAAIEGCIFKVPSIGYSLLDHHPNADFSHASEPIRTLSAEVIKTGLPEGVCLNVNIPKGELKGMKVCRQAMGQWIDEFVRSSDGQKKDVFWLTGRFNNDDPEAKETDEYHLDRGYASIVPVKVDLTAHEFVEQMKTWEGLF